MSLALKQARVAPQASAGIFGSLGRFVRRGIGAALGSLPVVGPAITVADRLAKRVSIAQNGIPKLGFGEVQPSAPGARAMGAVAVGTKIACPSGFHANKSSYFTLGGFVPKGSRCVKDRRRNPMNPRALDRAISRVDSGKRLQSKLASITTAKYTAGGARKPHAHA